MPKQPFDAEAFEYRFPTKVAAKLAIANELAMPLARLHDDDKAFIEQLVTDTLVRSAILTRVREYFHNKKAGGEHAG